MSSFERDQSPSSLASPCLGSSALSSLFDHLSDDILCIIFRLLSQQTPSSLNHALVCKRWLRLTYLSQTSIYMRPSRIDEVLDGHDMIQADSDLLKSLSKFTKLTSLTIIRCWIDDECEFLLGLGSACPNLTRLDLRNPHDAALFRNGMDAVFTAFTGLQYLSLAVGTCDHDLPPSFFGLSSLTEVFLQVDFTSLPEKFGKLTCLKKLTFDELQFPVLPQSFGLLTGLTELQLSRCKNFRHLPKTFGGLRSLVKLIISYADQLEDLPDSIGRLQNLQECSLIGNLSLVRLPDSFFSLTSLRVLELTKFDEMQRFLMSNFVLLESLTIRSCRSLNSLPLHNLAKLRFLVIRSCPALRKLPESLDRLPSLEHLELCQLSSLTRLPNSLSSLSNVRTFSFNHCNSVTRVPPSLLLNWTMSLTSLEFGWPTSCPAGSVADDTCFVEYFVGSVCMLENLSTLLLSGLPRVTTLPVEVYKLEHLQQLTLCSCPKLRSLPETSSLVYQLTSLRILACPECEDETGEIANIVCLESGCIDGRSLRRGRIGPGE